MSNYISKKINSLFSDEFLQRDIILVSPKKSPKLKKKKKNDSNNILYNIEDLILYNKGQNHSITKSKKKKIIQKKILILTIIQKKNQMILKIKTHQ